jgi:conjugal transfer/entry exclusion protein
MKKFMQIIPETETNLRSKISNYLENNIWNKAPEILNGYDLWMDLFNILKYNIGEMDAEWKQEILKIYNESK